jgi:hypothetical protein
MNERDDRPACPRRILVSRVTLERHGGREVPLAVCARRVNDAPVALPRGCTTARSGLRFMAHAS